MEERTDILGEDAGRFRGWDSCYTLGFSYVHGGSVRQSRRSRYRQWLIHKLGSWHDQFGCSGCVGCGRCITWCPVGIDITEEAAAIRGGDMRRSGIAEAEGNPMQSGIDVLLAEHPFFKGLSHDQLELLTGCASNVRFDAGTYLFREGEAADHFYVIRGGQVALDVYSAGRGALTVQTLGQGDVLGWSWLFPPYRWEYDAKAIETVRAVSLDGRCLRQKCETDSALGYELMKRFADVLGRWLTASRVQLLDLYCGDPSRRSGKAS
jgi:CRP/FNR family cyclic AMP-dependent transcriptional regulator